VINRKTAKARGLGRMSTLGANRTYRDGGNDVNDPYVWSGRAVQENSSSWRMCGHASMYPAFD
jgi:hypothetical protein